MNVHNCYLCGHKEYVTRPGKIRDNSSLKVLECTNCSLVYLSSFNHIASSHYEESGMHDGEVPDIESWLKETQVDDKRRYNFVKNKITNKKILDFGCGAGGFLEFAKMSATNVSGVELEKKLQDSFKSRGLNVYPNLKEAQKENNNYDLITSFHVIEHLSDPISTLKELASLLNDKGEMIIEVPNSDDVLLSLYDCQPFTNFTYWSQHLFLFNVHTFANLIKQAGLKLSWIKHVQRYSLSNHLYWLSAGKPGGHQKWSMIDNKNLNAEYENQLAAIGKTDTIIAGITK
ncbi:MAG: class I SAM-dependent methyltransferase [Gammaproteobacteria bacterium]|nr:class I SAM-dependent methyltransferase [Gammaproteobacteria bacterium]MCW9030135.1 class I SAM-dependent methyltransferase [Gammaproteobacteria bacterium]